MQKRKFSGKFELSHITDVSFGRASRGWICEMHFRVQTPRQCTMECHYVRGYGRQSYLGMLGLLTALWDAYRRTKMLVAELQAQPGTWNLDGTPKPQGAGA